MFKAYKKIVLCMASSILAISHLSLASEGEDEFELVEVLEDESVDAEAGLDSDWVDVPVILDPLLADRIKKMLENIVSDPARNEQRRRVGLIAGKTGRVPLPEWS